MQTETRLAIELVTVIIVALGSIGLWEYVRARREGPSAIEELTRANNALASRVRGVEQDRARDLEMLLSLQRKFEMQAAYSRTQAEYIQRQASYSEMLADRLRHLGQDVPPSPGNPPTPPPELSRPLMLRPIREESDRTTSLPGMLARLFNNEELDDLASRVGARPEDMMGETIARRAVSLVQWAQRRDKLDALIATACDLRPNGGFDSFVN